MRRGVFALSKTTELILVLIALIILVFFIYFLRDRITDYVEIALDFLSP